MWKQLTQGARKTIFLAQEEAGKLGYNHVGPEHLLLAVVRDEKCVAAKLLEQLGVDLGSVRVEVMNKVSRGSDKLGEDMQLTGEAKHAIDLAFEECNRMRDEWVGTEHLLTGLVQEDVGLASGLLEGMGVTVDRLRAEIGKLRAGVLPFDGVNERTRTNPLASMI